MQNAIAILIVVGYAGYVAWQLLRTIRSGNGKAGSCCSAGCADDQSKQNAAGQRIAFIDADVLRKRKPVSPRTK